MRHKFNAKRTKVGGRSYASKLEAYYAEGLEKAKKEGHILFFLEQIPFSLPGNLTYKLDFMEFWANGEIVCTEVKGYQTSEWKLKYKLFIETYPWIELNIVKKV